MNIAISFYLIGIIITISSGQNCPISDYSKNSNCSGFYRCSNGINTLTLCPGGQLYDENIKGCNWKSLVECISIEPQPPTYQASQSSLCSQKEFNDAVKNNGYPQPSSIQYNNLVSQATSKGGITSKNELAIFLAEILWESDGLRAKREYACYPNLGPNCAYSTGIGYPGQNYFGRGYIQLSWDYNYKAASQYLFNNDDLLKNPDQVASNDAIAWSTSFWFWKVNVIGSSYGKDVLNGYFGSATNAINGGLECRGPHKDTARKRFEIYKKVLLAFNVNKRPIENGCYN